MQNAKRTACTGLLCLASTLATAAMAQDAVSTLFSRIDNGGCEPTALTDTNWVISTYPVGTHGELLAGDVLRFELDKPSKGVKKQSAVKVYRNGTVWPALNGWTGECIRDGDNSLWVVLGEVNVSGCLHEIAIGRLDHDDNLTNKVEIIFEDSLDAFDIDCMHFDVEHPGHAHGTGSGD